MPPTAARAGRRPERMNISVYVDNLFDRRYRTYGYMNRQQRRRAGQYGSHCRYQYAELISSDYCKGIPKGIPLHH